MTDPVRTTPDFTKRRDDLRTLPARYYTDDAVLAREKEQLLDATQHGD